VKKITSYYCVYIIIIVSVCIVAVANWWQWLSVVYCGCVISVLCESSSNVKIIVINGVKISWLVADWWSIIEAVVSRRNLTKKENNVSGSYILCEKAILMYCDNSRSMCVCVYPSDSNLCQSGQCDSDCGLAVWLVWPLCDLCCDLSWLVCRPVRSRRSWPCQSSKVLCVCAASHWQLAEASLRTFGLVVIINDNCGLNETLLSIVVTVMKQ